MSFSLSRLRQRAFECARRARGHWLQYADCDDAAQDALVALLEAKSPVRCALAYVIGATRIHVVRRSKALALARRSPVAMTGASSSEPDAVQALLQKEEASRVRAIVRTMHPRHRQTLTVLLEVGYSSSIVAREFGIDRTQARVRMHRAIAAVRARRGVPSFDRA